MTDGTVATASSTLARWLIAEGRVRDAAASWFDTHLAPHSAVALSHAVAAARLTLRAQAEPALDRAERDYLGGLVKTLVGYASGVFGTQFVVAKAYARAIIVGVATIAHALMAGGLQAVIDQSWPKYAWTAVLSETIVNVIVGFVAFQVAESLPGAVARGRMRQRSEWGRRRW